jgi:predicted acylesterase/phospholipase RssA
MFKQVLNASTFSNRRRYGLRIFLSFLVLLICIWIFTGSKGKDITEPQTKDRHGTAIIITGAAAKIVQEAALLEQLQQRGMLNDVVFISGASSGALNATVLNAVLSNRFTWKQYIRILTSVSNDKIFIRNGRKLPVNTEPLRNLITRIVNDSLGYNIMSDLPYVTSFSIVNLKILSFKDRTYRLCNRQINKESDSTLNIVDVLMASTAIPLAFPPASIRNIKNSPDIPYHDGGVAADHIPYHALLEFEKYSGFEVEKMIIISRKRDTIPNMTRELEQFGIDKFKFFDKLDVSPESISNRGFYKRLKELQEESPSLAERTYIYVPNFREEFLMLDFSTLKEQYEVTALWAQSHTPLKLNDYLRSKKLD